MNHFCHKIHVEPRECAGLLKMVLLCRGCLANLSVDLIGTLPQFSQILKILHAVFLSRYITEHCPTQLCGAHISKPQLYCVLNSSLYKSRFASDEI